MQQKQRVREETKAKRELQFPLEDLSPEMRALQVSAEGNRRKHHGTSSVQLQEMGATGTYITPNLDL